MKLIRSFIFAGKGIGHCIRKEQNFRIHFLVFTIVIFLGFFLNVSAVEWCVLMMCSGMVMSLELINTSIEQLSNKVEPDYHHIIALVKDLSAGGVLVAAIISMICGSIIFIPKSISFFNH